MMIVPMAPIMVPAGIMPGLSMKAGSAAGLLGLPLDQTKWLRVRGPHHERTNQAGSEGKACGRRRPQHSWYAERRAGMAPKDGPINVYSIKKDGTTTTYATQ